MLAFLLESESSIVYEIQEEYLYLCINQKTFSMLTGMLHLHSLLRYVILIVGIIAIIKMAKGMSSNKKFTDADKKPGLFFLISMDLQLLIGLVLYFIGNWGIKQIQAVGFGEVMSNSIGRFFAMEHALGMVIAIILVHVGFAMTKKTDVPDQKRFKHGFFFFLIAYLLILAFIPWPFRELGRGWMPGM